MTESPCFAPAFTASSLPKIAAAAAIVATIACTSANALTGADGDEDKFPNAPIDYGYGPGQPIPKKSAFQRLLNFRPATATSVVPTGGSNAGAGGFFAPPVNWPINAIHQVLLPDGRVFNYGTSQNGAQGAQFVYDIWDPSLGTGSDSHLILPNTTSTDIFCGAQSLLGSRFLAWPNPDRGNVLISGGDLTIDGKRNFSNGKTEILNSTTNAIRSVGQMQYPRWYPSLIPLRNGDKLILGGNLSPRVPATVSELYTQGQGWRTLTGFAIPGDEHYYPRAYVGADGFVYEIAALNGKIYKISTKDAGSLQDTGVAARPAWADLPTVMFQRGKVLSVRDQAKVDFIDLNGPKPVVTPGPDMSQTRYWANATVLADGRVLVNGGSAQENQLVDVAYQAEIFDPATGKWSMGAPAAKARLYHSTALLLLDGSVLTAGGGTPGPVLQLNAEIYYPPYLYRNDGTGLPAVRPVIVSATDTAELGQTLSITVDNAAAIARVTLVRMGSVTHASNLEQRFLNLAFTKNGNTLLAPVPRDPQTMLPGFYMIFVISNSGVPSIAKVVSVPQAVLNSYQ